MSYYDFGETLKRLRESHGLTQSELGSHIGIAKAVISKYETGMGYPSLDVLTRFSKYFGVSTDFLLGIERGKTIDVSGLTDRQIEIIHQTIAEFNKNNKS